MLVHLTHQAVCKVQIARILDEENEAIIIRSERKSQQQLTGSSCWNSRQKGR